MIRLAQDQDTHAIWNAHVRSIREICSKDYEPSQIQGWSGFNFNHEHCVSTIKKDFVLVVEIEEKVKGFCHSSLLDDGLGEIKGLYFSPEAIGKGFGKEMVKTVIEHFKRHHCPKVILSATRTAKDFYLKMGFHLSGPEKVIKVRGTEIECLPMEMKL
jgi:ribosomal protein S18 acetylase RimI-like enzyme